MKLTNKVAIVTGASSGIGKDIAQLYAHEGATVYAVDINEARLNAFANSSTDLPGKIIPITADLMSQHATEYMVEQAYQQSGRLDILVNNVGIIISSLAGLFGARAGAAYTASKHALIGLTKNTAFMYAEKNIRCNAICPSGIATDIGSSEFMSHINQAGMQRVMTGIVGNPREGTSAEVASVALFLASSDASYMNGQCIALDGGWTAY